MYDVVYVAHSALHARAAHGEVQVRNMTACKTRIFSNVRTAKKYSVELISTNEQISVYLFRAIYQSAQFI